MYFLPLPPRPPPPPPAVPPYTPLTHTQLIHTPLAHAPLTHTPLTHTPIAHTPLTHIQLTHTPLAHTPLTHTQLTNTQLTDTQLTQTHTHTTHRHITYHTQLVLGDMDLPFAGQVWHLVTSTFTVPGRRGTYGTGLALVARLVPGDAARLCVAGVALGDIDLHFAWHAGHLVTSTRTLRGSVTLMALGWLWWHR